MPHDAQAARAAIAQAEEQITAILRKLEEGHGLKIEDVRVDTRNFANLATDIFAT